MSLAAERQHSWINSVCTRPPVYDVILRLLSPASCIRFGRTCRVARDSVLDFSSRAFNINRHFSHFFADPIAFRSLQARTATLVSGSNALQFLDRTFYPEADLDLYVHPGHSLEVGLWLMQKEGYGFFPSASQEDKEFLALADDDWDGTVRRIDPTEDPNIHDGQRYRISGVGDVYTFKKTSQNPNTPPLKVQVMVSESNPLQCIFGFHSTCVMNVITYDAAYSLYPRATFEDRIALSMSVSNAGELEALAKYKVRGWRIYSLFWPREWKELPFFLSEHRRVDDNKSWVVPLDTTGVHTRPPLSQTSPEFSWDPVIQNSWRLVDSPKVMMTYYEVKSTIFRYNYMVADEGYAIALRHWCKGQGGSEHAITASLSKEERCKAWTWWDAEIALLLQKHNRRRQKNRMLVN